MCLIIINFQLFAYLHLHILDISAVFFLASFTNCLFCQYSQIHSVLVKRSKERKRERERIITSFNYLSISATINCYRRGLHCLWFQSTRKNLSSEAWMGLAWRNLHGKKKVLFLITNFTSPPSSTNVHVLVLGCVSNKLIADCILMSLWQQWLLPSEKANWVWVCWWLWCPVSKIFSWPS